MSDGRGRAWRLGQLIRARMFVIYIACNMIVCAVVFSPWALPRETISGLLGRWRVEERRGWKRTFSGVGARIVDTIYFWEVDHCIEVFKCERKAREILYPC